MKQKKPRSAYHVVDVTGGWGVACVVEGESGYHPVDEYGPYAEEARAKNVVDALNARTGVSKELAHRIARSTMPGFRSLPKLTLAQDRVLRRMPDRPSDGARMKGPNYIAALSCVEKGWAVLVGRDLVGGHFARLPAGRAALGLGLRAMV